MCDRRSHIQKLFFYSQNNVCFKFCLPFLRSCVCFVTFATPEFQFFHLGYVSDFNWNSCNLFAS